MKAQDDIAALRRPSWGYPERSLFVFGLFLVFVVARYMQWGARQPIFAAIRIEFTLGLLLTVLCTVMLMSRPFRLARAQGVLAGIALLFLVMLVQLPFSADPVIADNMFNDRVVKFAFLTFFMVVLLESPRYMMLFLLAFLLSCFYITQESVRGLISGGLVWENQGVMRLHGAVPIYAHPNSLGGLAMSTVPFCVFLIPVIRAWYLRAGLLVLLVLALTCVLYTGSRTAWVAMIAFLVFWFFTTKRKLRWLVRAVIVGSVVVALIPAQYKERFASITGGQEVEGRSRESRLVIMQDALAVFMKHPAGVGLGSFPAVRAQMFGRAQDTHNLYLEIATNLGVQGLAVFLFLMVMLLNAYRAASRGFSALHASMLPRVREVDRRTPLGRRVERHVADLQFLKAVATAAAGYLYVRLVLGFFGMDLYEVYWWFGSGLAISLLALTRNAEAVSRRLHDACSAEVTGILRPLRPAGATEGT